jgi:hypothetical protein
MCKDLFGLNKGIRLEKSDTIVPWKTSLNELEKYGNPEIRRQPGKTIVTWKNERILNGLPVDLRVVYDVTESGRGELSCVSAYLCESTFEAAKEQLNGQIRRKAEFRQLNEIEFQYVWKIRNNEVVLSHLDRFGSFWRIDIRHKHARAKLPGLRSIFGLRPRIRESVEEIQSLFFQPSSLRSGFQGALSI